MAIKVYFVTWHAQKQCWLSAHRPWAVGKSAFCVKEVNGGKPLRAVEAQPQILYLSAFCIKPITADGTVSTEASTGKSVAQRRAPNHSQKTRSRAACCSHDLMHLVLPVQPSPSRVPLGTQCKSSVTGIKGKSVSTQTSLWEGAAGTVSAWTFLPNCTSAVVNYWRFKVVEANDAAEIPDKADIFLVLPQPYEYLTHMLWILFLEVFQYLSKLE